MGESRVEGQLARSCQALQELVDANREAVTPIDLQRDVEFQVGQGVSLLLGESEAHTMSVHEHQRQILARDLLLSAALVQRALREHMAELD